MALPPGLRLGPYEILAKLGEGGMGEVYRARDTRLKRDVAIKVLPELFASDPDRLARFEREAELLATLNHPNVAAIYGFEEASSVTGIVLELVEGPTLADRIGQGALPLDDAVSIARQVVDALEAAHDKGIVHRDLKPANIKLTAGGQVKVLDFGLAKALEPVSVRNGAALSMSPTMVSPPTQVGMIVGTAAYMSPEQARGKAVDQRADIWAFGCVLFEMLSGRPPLETGETVSDAIATILTQEPAWNALPAATPPSIRRLLRRCIEKDVNRRLRHIADVRLDLEDATATDEPLPDARSARPRGPRPALPWLIAAVLALGIVTVAGVWFRPAATRPVGIVRLDLNLPTDLELYSAVRTIAVSPNGSRVAFIGVVSGGRQVYLRPLDQLDAVALRGTDNASTCFFSADGNSIGFVTASGVLKTVSLSDGVVGTVTDGVSNANGLTWTERDVIVFTRGNTLWRVPSGGGAAQPLTTLDATRHESRHAWPLALPGGRMILFGVAVNEKWRIDSLDLTSGERRVVMQSAVLPLNATNGYLAFVRDGRVLAAPFDAKAVKVSGPAIQLLADVPILATGIPLFDLSASGTFVYSATTAVSRLVWVSRHGDEQMLNDDRRNYTSPRVSPDGQRIIVQAGDLWMQDLTRGTFSRLTNGDMSSSAFPRWRPDGRIIYRSPTGLRLQGTNGPGDSVQMIPGTTEMDYPGPLAPDGDTQILLRSTETTSFDILAMSLRSPSKVWTILKTPAYEAGASLSPDGRWLSYVSNETGRNEIYVMPYPGPGERRQVSTQGGTQAVWSRDGHELFYRIDDKMVAVDVVTTPQLRLSTPKVLFEGKYAYGAGVTIANFDVSGDGQHFVMVKPESGAGRLNVVLNWFADRGKTAASD